MWRYLPQSVEAHRDLIMLLDVVTDVCHGTLLYVWFDISSPLPNAPQFEIPSLAAREAIPGCLCWNSVGGRGRPLYRTSAQWSSRRIVRPTHISHRAARQRALAPVHLSFTQNPALRLSQYLRVVQCNMQVLHTKPALKIILHRTSTEPCVFYSTSVLKIATSKSFTEPLSNHGSPAPLFYNSQNFKAEAVPRV